MKALILDMDGVIIDSEPMHFKLERELLEELGGRISPREQEEFVGRTDRFIWSELKARFRLKEDLDRIIDMKKDRFLERIGEIGLVENFRDFLEMIGREDLKIAIASSNNRGAVERVIEFFDLADHIDFYISGEEVERGKPDPEIFLKAAEKLGVSPKDCLVIEDATSGIRAAKAAGMKSIGLDNPNSGRQDLAEADLVIAGFRDLSMEKIRLLFE